ncbi:DExH-box ATP-dependent RNA helicase DExH8-like isoform X3 [Syzygium oleosum]|uniref:DExH-box ATP-dependent RNA helicase DExH8-like isoform X3 n=1 Tax=Syzygium oleosum TaxID=219896 RepID=UPI0024BBE822|nr:DExH-box ATP-dependent RNA helicase DExH8-like isoform X3 [Syzygium oleosum]
MAARPSSPTTPSCSSSCSSQLPSSSGSPPLPIMALREMIVEKILENRVTLIVGETGCGKSSQVPQFLLERNIYPAVCVQPCESAVVDMAKMVAKARNCELGGEVGYHIGHLKNISSSSKIAFKTAEVLLDEILQKGLNALDYKAIIVDEVHERSVESDLLLIYVKQFLLENNNLRVVLMSAIADIAKFRDYFGDIARNERVEVVAIPNSNQQTIYQRSVLYLEQVTKLLGISSESLSVKYCNGESPSTADADIEPEVHRLIHDLVMHIHENEPDIEKSILIFLPTYRSKVQQWRLLKSLGSLFKVILRDSIDTEEALLYMKMWKSQRKIILAAESSVTMPKVAFIIDSCRSLQVYWDGTRKCEFSGLKWVSKLQAERRRGRTGRTCDGEIYRLVTQSFFSDLEDYKCPTMLRLSLQLQILLICCAELEAINDPRVLLQKALDPPDPDVVQDALDLLVHMGALQTSHRGRLESTFYGRLLASLSLSFEASLLVIKFGEVGLLHEGILLGVLMDKQSLPIIHVFGEDDSFTKYLDNYFSRDTNKPPIGPLKEVILMANLCAFKFWQRIFKDKYRTKHLNQVLQFDDMKATKKMVLETEEEWCFLHNLSRSSLNHVAETYEDVLSSLHRFRPNFLGTSEGFPSYYYPCDFQHKCLLECRPNEDEDEDEDAAGLDDEELNSSADIRECVAMPFVAPNDFQTKNVADKLTAVVKEIKAHYYGLAPSDQPKSSSQSRFSVNKGGKLCRHFLKGSCSRGSNCSFSQSFQAKKPMCKFFVTLQGCRNGDSCFFSHDLGTSFSSVTKLSSCIPENGDADPALLIRLFPFADDGNILILDDTTFHFTSNIARSYDPFRMVATTRLLESSICDPSLTDVKIMWGFHHPYQTIIGKSAESQVLWKSVKCVLWFPDFEVCGHKKNFEGQRSFMKNFFEYLAIRLLADSLCEVPVVLTMNNLRFSKLQVEKLGRSSFFFLTESFPFAEQSFGELSDVMPTKKLMEVSKPISYVFRMYPPPTDVKPDDFQAAIRKCLHDVQ